MKQKQLILFFLFLFFTCIIHAQEIAADTTQPVSILNAKNLYWKKIDANTELQILAGKVQLKQGNTLFYCDSCIVNNTAHFFEAFGNVHINDNDTTNVYSDHLK